MPVIKRYANRKLYDTEQKRYITLERIADLIRLGETVQVQDNVTGEDLTALTLSQIIFEQEKKQRGFLPQTVLAGLVQAGGDTVNTLRRSLATPLNLLLHVDEEIKRRIVALVDNGDLSADEGVRIETLLLSMAEPPEEIEWPGEVYLKNLLTSRGLPSRSELDALNEQLNTLNEEFDKLTSNNEQNSPAQ